MRLVFLVLSLFHFADFVYSGPTENAHPSISIIGGTAATSGDFPFMASLPLALGSCGGTLIDPSYVLTAAHCVSLYTQSDAAGFPVYLNTLNVLGGADSINATVSSFVVHDGYANVGTGFVNDIALLVLSQPVTTINPVPLPKDSGAPTEGATTTAIVDTTTTTKTTTKPTTTTTKTTTKPTTTKTTTKPTTTTTTKTTTKPKTTATTKTTTKPKTTTTTKTTTKPKTTTTTKTTTKPKTTMKITTPSPSGTTLSCTCTQSGATTSSGSMNLLCNCSPLAKPTTKKAAMRDFFSYTKKPALRDLTTYENMDAVITGWGVQADGFNSDTLMSTGVTIFGNAECTTKWGSKLFDGNSMMCAAKDGQSACLDDDGGPIIVDGVQVGIASFFPETCGDSNFPAVFTRTSAYIEWIKGAMAANPPPSQS